MYLTVKCPAASNSTLIEVSWKDQFPEIVSLSLEFTASRRWPRLVVEERKELLESGCHISELLVSKSRRKEQEDPVQTLLSLKKMKNLSEDLQLNLVSMTSLPGVLHHPSLAPVILRKPLLVFCLVEAERSFLMV